MRVKSVVADSGTGRPKFHPWGCRLTQSLVWEASVRFKLWNLKVPRSLNHSLAIIPAMPDRTEGKKFSDHVAFFYVII